MRILLLFISLFVIVSISCNSNDSPTDTGDNNDGKVSISGYVFQQANGLIHFVSGAEVKIGNVVTSSDSTGRYNLQIDPGYYDLTVSHPYYLMGERDSLDFTVDREYDLEISGIAISVSGIVSHEIDGPIAGAIVRVKHLADTTDDAGCYFIDSLIQGEWEFEIESDNYLTLLDTISIWRKYEFTIDCFLKRPNIHGFVWDVDSQAIVGAMVELDSMSTTSNVLGSYMFRYLDVKNYVVHCSYPGYNSFSDTVYADGEILYNIVLDVIRPDTVWIDKDATVSTIHNSDAEDTNYGDGSYLSTIIDIYKTSDTVYYDYKSAFYIKIPTFDYEDADSVLLVLTSSRDSHFENLLIFTRVSDNWDESTITWNSQAYVQSPSIASSFNLDAKKRWHINITDVIDFFTYTSGLRVVSCGICNFCTCGQTFYSSDYEEESKRPMILIYR